MHVLHQMQLYPPIFFPPLFGEFTDSRFNEDLAHQIYLYPKSCKLSPGGNFCLTPHHMPCTKDLLKNYADTVIVSLNRPATNSARVRGNRSVRPHPRFYPKPFQVFQRWSNLGLGVDDSARVADDGAEEANGVRRTEPCTTAGNCRDKWLLHFIARGGRGPVQSLRA